MSSPFVPGPNKTSDKPTSETSFRSQCLDPKPVAKCIDVRHVQFHFRQALSQRPSNGRSVDQYQAQVFGVPLQRTASFASNRDPLAGGVGEHQKGQRILTRRCS
jgi:hypothetical protein